MVGLSSRCDCLALEYNGRQIILLLGAAAEVLNRKTQSRDNFLRAAVVRLKYHGFESLQPKLLAFRVLPLIETIGDQHDHVVGCEPSHKRLLVIDSRDHAERNSLGLEIFDFASGVLVPEDWPMTSR